MSMADEYLGVPGRASYFGDGQVNRQFTLWSKKSEREPVLYVYVPKVRVERDRGLELVCDGARDVERGFMVTMPHWESRITPDGYLRDR